METKELELDGKQIKIVVKLNGEYPEDIDIKENYIHENNQKNIQIWRINFNDPI